ncbi:MAG TPA: condensation domain-containing protein, partial [Candidatus Deferrimicrobium sp.]|nr:condensation domain-containing protein [Candidatus Deferrimicrobium sp.]
PIPTLSTYLFDPGLKLSPIGIPGELCVGGEGVARGYLNRPELTYQKFIENPFKKGEKLYKSGDLVRLSYDGEMEYLGRIDQQIQVRGFRVELGEIESRLLKFPGIKETVVLALEEKGDKYLCAYIVSDREYGRSELRKHLSNELPDYMMPAYFVRLEKIPLTPSGKVDRRALPVPYLKAGESYTAPGNEIETKLVELWAGILGRDELHASQLQTSIGIDDNFFELGGHSLKVTILVSRIHKVFDVKVPLTEIFKRPKIRELANYIKEKRKEYYISIEPVEKQEYYRLSSAQKRLYILQQIGLNGIAYNLPEIIPLPAASDWKKIAETFKKLIQRHEGLRTSFHMIDDTPVQVIHDRVEFGIGLLDSNRSHDSQGNIKQFIRPFDLSIAPLIRVGLINEEDKRRFLIIDMHHIISDGVSHQVLVKDFFSIYNEETIPPLRVQYKDFAEWQNGENEAENLIRQESYWLKEFAGEIPALELPTDFPRPEAQSFEGDIVDFAISAEETRALDAMALNGGATLFMVLVAVVNILFSKLSSQEDIVIGTPIAGRRHADLDKIIGMFVNTLSLRNNPTGDRTFRDFLGEVKEKTLAAFENQEYPFEELVDKLSVKRDMGRNPLFDVMFALQNMNTGLADRDKEAGFETHRPDPFDSLKEYGSIFQSSKFDLTLNVIEKGAVLFLSFEYCTKLFKKETVERFIIYFKKIVSTVVTNPLVRISEIGIITEEEKKRILHDFNETNVEYPRDKTIHLLFEEQVKRTPDYIALIDSYLQVSYRELDKKSGVLAHVLQSKGTGSDTIVGIMMERSVEMIAAILGILKSGGAYLPIDPDYPLERVNYMLRDSAAGILINKSPFEAQST